MNTTFDLLTASIHAATAKLEKKMTDVAEASQRSCAEGSRSLSAHVGEMEDKLDKVLGPQRG